MIVIGELINGTRKKVKKAIAEKDAEYIAGLAKKQVAAGADFVDCNPGTVGEQEVSDMVWLVETVQAVTDKPIAFDSPNAEAVRAGIAAYRGGSAGMINSITLESERLNSMLPVVKEADMNVVALALDDAGMPTAAGQREETAKRLIDTLVDAGISAEKIFVDPVIAPVSTQPEVAGHILQAIEAIRDYCPQCHITGGLSNISFGLPNRRLLNRTFLTLAIAAGMDSAVMDPLDKAIMAEVLAAEALTGKDEWCMNYITASREGKLDC